MKITNILSAASAGMAGLLVLSSPANAQSGTQFIGQTTAFGFNFCPRGWTAADGKLLSISQYTAVFSIVGTIYGGDGRTTFGVPDLRGRRAVGDGNGPGIGNYPIGSKGGSTQFTVVASQLPSHNHTGTMMANNMPGISANPTNKTLASDSTAERIWLDAAPNTSLRPNILSLTNTGGGQAVNKLSPYQVLNWCFSLEGIFPSRS